MARPSQSLMTSPRVLPSRRISWRRALWGDPACCVVVTFIPFSSGGAPYFFVSRRVAKRKLRGGRLSLDSFLSHWTILQRETREKNAAISFTYFHTWPQYGRCPRAVARHGHE